MKSRDILAAVRQGRKIRTPWVIIHARSHPGGGLGSISCIVGKKVDRRAVARHRYQRWLRELVRAASLQFPPATDIVIVALPAIRNIVSLADLRSGLTPYFQKLGNE